MSGWKVYFYFYLVLSIISFLLLLNSVSSFTFYDWLSFAETVGTPILLYSFVYGTKLGASIKNGLLAIFTVFWVITIVYYFLLTLQLQNQLSLLGSSFRVEQPEIWRGILINIPMFYVASQLLFEKKEKKNPSKKKRK